MKRKYVWVVYYIAPETGRYDYRIFGSEKALQDFKKWMDENSIDHDDIVEREVIE